MCLVPVLRKQFRQLVISYQPAHRSESEPFNTADPGACDGSYLSFQRTGIKIINHLQSHVYEIPAKRSQDHSRPEAATAIRMVLTSPATDAPSVTTALA